MSDLFDTEPRSSSGAVISACGKYRYRLGRTWDAALRPACFVMLNPSTADATEDDPTIRRCIGFAKSWGCGGIVVVNLFAYRATDPKQLLKAADPVGPDNDEHIRAAVVECHPVVAAWGVHGVLRQRDGRVKWLLERWGVLPKCLGKTKDGRHPRHPLYVRADTALVRLSAPHQDTDAAISRARVVICRAVGPHHGDPCSGGRVAAPNAQFTVACAACGGTGEVIAETESREG